MAETLGSLIDKLTIKSIREFHLDENLKAKKSKFPKAELKLKMALLMKQKTLQLKEIEDFINLALNSKITLREEKIKLYNKPADIGRIGKNEKLSKAIEGLSRKNIELWHLEDEARRADMPLSYIGKIKKKIDPTNQQRNDFIDKIDELFEKAILKKRKNKK
ncbi:MAG: DUF4254 domain-containing protein [Candidatus Omnitrophica bacterium]|nr:DUF4254 domain-containing protein [Candidatus Omnitrophota bacterium]